MRSKYCMREPLLRNVTPNEGKCHYHNSFSVEFIKKTQSVGEKTMLLWWGKDCPMALYSLRIGKRSRFGHSLGQTLGI